MNPERVGRDGSLGLRFARRGRATALLRCRFTLPLQAFPPLCLEDGAAYQTLLNPTGGVLGGDRLTTEITLEEHTHVCLTTPSATRIYRTDRLPSILNTVIRVGEGAALEYFPDHVIPQAGSMLRQSLRVEIAAGARVLLWEAMAGGRVDHGERWKFTEVLSRTDVLVHGAPAYLNRTKIAPAAIAPERPGMMEEFPYCASLAVFADGFADWPGLAAAMRHAIEEFSEAQSGVGRLAGDGCLVRLLARTAIDLTAMGARLWAVARAQVLGLPPLETRKY